jgi:hypothetical protein
MIAFAQMDADTAGLQFNQFTDDLLKFGVNVLGPAKPEIKKIAENIKIIDRRRITPQFPVMDKRSGLPALEIVQKPDQPAVSFIPGILQMGIGYKNSFHNLVLFRLKCGCSLADNLAGYHDLF